MALVGILEVNRYHTSSCMRVTLYLPRPAAWRHGASASGQGLAADPALEQSPSCLVCSLGHKARAVAATSKESLETYPKENRVSQSASQYYSSLGKEGHGR